MAFTINSLGEVRDDGRFFDSVEEALNVLPEGPKRRTAELWLEVERTAAWAHEGFRTYASDVGRVILLVEFGLTGEPLELKRWGRKKTQSRRVKDGVAAIVQELRRHGFVVPDHGLSEDEDAFFIHIKVGGDEAVRTRAADWTYANIAVRSEVEAAIKLVNRLARKLGIEKYIVH